MSTNHLLEKYRKRRNFKKTSEPDGDAIAVSDTPKNLLVFVIQEHHATNLHYDLRLEIDGVLKSWAVPKGISQNPKDKRLAIPTEDHPLAYKDFAGIIPEGEYGAGEVIIWDKGFYKNLKNISMQDAWQQGKIEIEFNGNKIHGKYALIKMKTAQKTNVKTKPKSIPWLLIKIGEKQ